MAVGAIAAVVQPECLIFARPPSKASPFARGVGQTVKMSFCSAFGNAPVTHTAAISYLRATELIGLEKFLLGPSTNASQGLATNKAYDASRRGNAAIKCRDFIAAI